MEQLASDDDVRREAAIARLTVIGSRAVSRLVSLASDAAAPAAARVAAVQALDAIGDPRGVAAALSLSAGPDDRVAGAAVLVLGRAARGEGARATRAFDRLAALTLDRAASVERRLAALTGLGRGDDRTLAPIYEALRHDASSRMRRAARGQVGATTSPASLTDAAAGTLPDDPAALATLVRDESASAAITTLRQIIDVVRARERTLQNQAGRERWMAVRGQIHQQLASRKSRLAVYDLRETLDAFRGAMPVGFVAAVAAIGDVTCLEPLARAWLGPSRPEGTPRTPDRWWRDHLADAFGAIVRREGLTRRHAAVTRILERWPGAGALVAAAPISRRRTSLKA